VRELLQVLYFFVPAYLANMSPVLIGSALPALAAPIDVGRTFRGRRILGDHKTWRGLLVGVAAGVVVFALQRIAYDLGALRSLALIDYHDHGLWPGFLLGLGTGVGDAAKSFFKRQLGIAPGASWLGFDQLDFMVGAYVFVGLTHFPPLLPTLASLPIIFAGSIAITSVGYGLGFKESWI